MSNHATPPSFLETDPFTILQQVISDYEAEIGKPLQDGQIERTLINTIAYRESLIRIAIQKAAEQNLLSFSTAPILDFLGDIVGVTRLPSSRALTTIRFVLPNTHTGVTIPEGTRVQSSDGQVVFETEEDVNVSAGVESADASAFSQDQGAASNGFGIGVINTIIDTQPFLLSASNITETGGGSNQETDEALRERISLAPGQYSTAGSEGSYIFFAKSANPSIVDVFVDVDPAIPGDVNIFVLTDTGEETSQEVLDQVDEALNDTKIRPLTDTVFVNTGVRVTVTIDIEITTYDTAVNDTVTSLATSALDAFVSDRITTLGKDALASQIIEAATVDGVYDVQLPNFVDIVIQNNEFLNLEYSLSITGSNEG